MEPRILLIESNAKTVELLLEEIRKYGRDITGSADIDEILKYVRYGDLDIVVIGEGLSDQNRQQYNQMIKQIRAELPVEAIERHGNGSPYHMVEYVNRLALEWKLETA